MQCVFLERVSSDRIKASDNRLLVKLLQTAVYF